MRKKIINTNAKINRFGYIGYDMPEVIKNKLQMHDLFKDKEVEVATEQDLFSLINGLKKGKYDYIIIPAKNENNEINDMFLSLISRLTSDGINEIGMIIGQMSYHHHSLTSNELGNVTENPIDSFKSGNTTSTYHISDEPADNIFTNKIEYRIFKLNNYKTSPFTRFGIWLLKKNHLKKILGWSSGVVAFAMLVFLVLRLIPSIKEKIEEISILVELIATTIIIILQLILRLANTEETIKRKLITGYWIYYSLEETDSNMNFVPKGFRTRLVQISDIDDRLTFKCKFAGDDQIFFATDTLTFEYDQSLQMGRGFYYYTSNIQNNKKRRAEGTCRFEGETTKSNQIMAMNGWFFSRGTLLTGKVLYLRISKNDYEDLQKSLTFYDLNNTRDDHLIIGVYGGIASNTDLAAHDEEIIEKIVADISHKDKMFSDLLKNKAVNELIEYCYFNNIKDMKRALTNHQIDYALIPTANRGRVIAEHNIFEDEAFTNVFSKSLEIKYVLGTIGDQMKITNDTIFYGHSQSRIQCQSFIKNNTFIETSSSAQAALNMSKGYYGNNSVVICNETALNYYHLRPLLDSNGQRIDPYQDSEKNLTAFTIYRMID